MFRLAMVIPQLLWSWRLTQCLDEEEGEGNLRPEDLVRGRADQPSKEDKRSRRDRQLLNHAKFDELVRLVGDKAGIVARALARRGWPEAELQEVILGETAEPKRLFRRTRYRQIIEELVVWPLNDETDFYLGRDGLIYGDYDVLRGAYRPSRLFLLEAATLKQLDHDLDALRGRLLSSS